MKLNIWGLYIKTHYTHFVLAENVFLFEGEQYDITEICRVFDVDVFSPVLQHTGCLVDDPVRAEDGNDEPSSYVARVCIHVYSELLAGVTGKAHRE